MGYSHYSVMKNEILSFINTKENKTLIDATLGMGGHTLSISEASSGRFNFLCFGYIFYLSNFSTTCPYFSNDW